MSNNDLEDLEFEYEEIEEIDESSTEELSKIVSYNVANTVEVLKFKIDGEEIDLKPEFQRDFVWDINRASLFIDSLLIGLPIPSIFLGKSKEDETYMVIDGQQRLKSAYYYMQGTFKTNGREQTFALRKLEGRDWDNKTFAELEDKYKRRIRNAVINTTVVEDIDTNPRVVHDIFHRLNTGGMSLTDQEIRNCVYNGAFNNAIINLNLNSDWRRLIGKNHADRRMRDVEMIVRFFGLYEKLSTYSPSMREFLSNYQSSKSKVVPNLEIFNQTVSLINSEVGEKAFKITRSVNKSVCDALMVSVAQIIHEGKTIENFAERHERLIADDEFRKYVSSGTTSESSVKGRISIAKNYLLGLK